MDYIVPCDCGRSLIVRAGDAGATKSCDCGKQLQIPPLSVLRESPNVRDGSTDATSQGGHAGVFLFVATIGIAVFASLQSPALLVLVGFLTFIVGRVWFAMQILREMAPPNALMVLFVPFMPTIFFFQRLDITWKPFLYGIMGIVMLMIGLPASQP
jgi:hypothetical protein